MSRRRKVVSRKDSIIPTLLKEEDDGFLVNGYSSDDEWGVRWKTSVPAAKRRRAAKKRPAGGNGCTNRRAKRCLRPFFLPRCTIVLRCHEDASEGVWVSWEANGLLKAESQPTEPAKAAHSMQRERSRHPKLEEARDEPPKAKQRNTNSRCSSRKSLRSRSGVVSRVKTEPVSPLRKDVSGNDYAPDFLPVGNCLQSSPAECRDAPTKDVVDDNHYDAVAENPAAIVPKAGFEETVKPAIEDAKSERIDLQEAEDTVSEKLPCLLPTSLLAEDKLNAEYSPGGKPEKDVCNTIPVISYSSAVVVAEEAALSWTKVSPHCTFVMNTVEFCPPFDPGPDLSNCQADAEPVDLFLELCNEKIVDFLVNSINIYLDSILKECVRAKGKEDVLKRGNDWLPTTSSELYRFFAVCINMSIVQKAKVCDYWITTPEHSCTPWFLEMFTRRRFFVLYRSILRISQGPSKWKERVSSFLRLVVASFQDSFQPGQEVIIEELGSCASASLDSVRWVESCEPDDWEMKCFILSDASSGYVWNMVPYFGDNPKNGMLPQENIVLELTAPLKPGHHVFTSSRFTSVSLIQKMYSRGVLCTGNVKQTAGLPNELLDAVLTPGEVKYYQSKHILCSAWKDVRTAKPIIFCTTWCAADDTPRMNGQETCEEDVFPPCLQSYQAQNKCLSAEQNSGTKGLHLRTKKDRWKKVFWWTIELFLFNSYVMFVSRTKEKNVSLLDFKRRVLEKLVHRSSLMTKTETISVDSPYRLLDIRHLIYAGSQSGKCVVCCHAETNFFCKNCPDKPYLHAQNCFARYHEALECNNDNNHVK